MYQLLFAQPLNKDDIVCMMNLILQKFIEIMSCHIVAYKGSVTGFHEELLDKSFFLLHTHIIQH